MSHVDLGLLGSAQAKVAGTALTITNTSGAAIPAGALLFLSLVTDNPASTTTPTMAISAYTGGGSWAANKVTSIGVTTTAGAGIHHFSTWVKTTTSIAAGATIATVTLSASTVAKSAIVVGFTNVGAFKVSGQATTAGGLSGSSSLGISAGQVVAGDFLIDIEAQEAATYTPQSSTVNGTWSTAVSFGTTGGSAVTNVVVGAQNKDSTGSAGWSNTIQNMAGEQSMHGYVFSGLSAPPVANAGNDQTVNSGDTVNLTGAASTDDVGISTYAWTQTAGTAVTLTGAATNAPSFQAPGVAADTTLTFQLTVTDADGQSSTDTVNVLVQPAVLGAGVSRRGAWVQTIPSVAMVAGTPIAISLPIHQAGDRLFVLEVGKYAGATLPMTADNGFTVVGSGQFQTGQANGTDTGTLHWNLYAKDAASAAETLNVTPGTTVPNSAIFFASAWGSQNGWLDAVASIPKSAAVDTDITGVLAAAPAAFGTTVDTGDVILMLSGEPTDTPTAVGAVSLTNAGLSGGSVANVSFAVNPLGTDMAGAIAEWTGFTGTESGAYSASVTMTGTTAPYGGILLVALRAAVAVAPTGFTGWGIPM